MKGFLFVILALYFLLGCAVVEPTTKPASPTHPTYAQILKDNYKGPKARVALIKFVDKSARDREMSQVGDGFAEMLRHALLATNRYIVQVRRSQDDINGDQGYGNGGRIKKEKQIDLLVDGEVREFKAGIPGTGDEDGASYVTILLTLVDPRSKQVLASEKVRTKATANGGHTGKAGGALPEMFKGFSRTLMEKAIRITIEESASLIVAKTPPESYRVIPPVVQKETYKPPPAPQKVAPPPRARTTHVAWDSVNLREGPGTGYKVIGNAKKGASLIVVDSNGDWLRVRLENGRKGWVNRSATSEAPSHSPSTPSAPPPPM